MHFPIQYDEPLFRPPSEGRSLIIQATLGCSWNECSFCEMYTTKRFKSRREEDVFADIEAFAPYKHAITKVFIADGDPLVLSTKRLIRILNKIKDTFPNLKRISTYASPNNLNRKSAEELKELHDAGLTLLYVGIESGDDQVLEYIKKGETHKSTIEGINKGTLTGMDCSVMIISGVGGKHFSKQHAIQSAKVLNETQPKFASTLVLTTHRGFDHFKNRLSSKVSVEFEQLNQLELFTEMKLFMENLTLDNTIFRSDHASNILVLKGVLGKDKQAFLNQIDLAINHPSMANLRSQFYSGY